jgi:hypothetical protein
MQLEFVCCKYVVCAAASSDNFFCIYLLWMYVHAQTIGGRRDTREAGDNCSILLGYIMRESVSFHCYINRR